MTKAKTLETLAEAVGGKIEEVVGPLPDGSGFATMSMPLPADHWLTREGLDEPPMPLRMGTRDRASILLYGRQRHHTEDLTRNDFAELLRAAGRYALRAATENGKVMDLDPDALLQNLVIGLLGYWSHDGNPAIWVEPTPFVSVPEKK